MSFYLQTQSPNYKVSTYKQSGFWLYLDNEVNYDAEFLRKLERELNRTSPEAETEKLEEEDDDDVIVTTTYVSEGIVVTEATI